MSGIPAGAGQLLGKRLGKFEILALLALGGTAEIYLARIGGAAGFEKYVVVKCLHDHLADDAEFVKMFLDEARLAAHLDHSNIVQTMELGQHDGRYYMVMEFLAGLSLAMIVRRAVERLPNGRIPVPLVLNMLAQSCAGLHYAHEKAMNGRALNIVHRDISPQNLVVSFEGVVKVVDFGIAKAEMRETHTRSGTIKGKFAYMSPEQCVANNVDRRTDVFALGVIGHELLTGRRLFKRPSPYETYQSVIDCDVKPPSATSHDLDPALDAVIMRALTKDKVDRYPTAEAFGDALLGYLHHRGIGSGPGDVSRFFDAYFGQEIEEHSGRMRELISGRDIPVETGVSWGADEIDEVAKREASRSGADAAGGDSQGPSGRLSDLDDDGAGGSRVEDDDEMPAERTRIESNPLERINELDRLVSSTPRRGSSKPASPRAARPATAEPLANPAPPAVASTPASGSAPKLPSLLGTKPGAAKSPPAGASGSAVAKLPGMPVSGRFPDLANLPTMIAPDVMPDLAPPETSVPPAVVGFANAPTGLAPSPGVPPAASAFASAPTKLAHPVSSVPPPSASAFANVPTTLAPSPDHATQIVPPPDVPPASAAVARTAPPGPPPRPASASKGPLPTPAWAQAPSSARPVAPLGSGPSASSSPPIQQPAMPPGYPVMSAQLSAQIATGATVFQSETRGDAGDSYSQLAHLVGPGAPGASGAHDAHRSPAGHNGHLSDAQRAANLMSPVGRQYPEQVDWTAAAAARARAVPPWLLALLFLGAIGVALILTIVIAKLIR